ncbi:MAG TPA: SDR family NAD(P)-dependent oxidoreductase [Flavobacterium sp.]|jgi:short-subunit dehydrogenase
MLLKQLLLKIKLLLLSISVAVVICSCATSKLGKSGQRKMAGKTYVILGASSGLGRGVAEELGEYKANVVLASRRTGLLEEIATGINASGGKALVVTTDISKPEEVQRLADAAVRQYGTIDVWVNMAGVGAIGRFWDIPQEDQARIIDVNLKGFIYGSHAAVQQFRKQGYGVLINMGSVDSETPHAYQAAYSASKAGIKSLSLALAQELRLNNYDKIKVVTIQPWAIDTPFWDHAANYSGVAQKFPAMDEPDKVVNAILRSSLRPKRVVSVGWKAKGSSLFHSKFPRFTEWFTGNVAHKNQAKGTPAPNTKGAIYKPVETGRGVKGGVKERMKQENKQR